MKLPIPTAACAAAIAVLTAGCASVATQDRAGNIVEMAKVAMGGPAWDRLEIMHDWGQVISANAVASRYDHWSDLLTLQTRSGSDDGYMIFDGRHAIHCEDRTCTRRTTLNASFVRSGAYLTSFGFFFPNRFPVSFHYVGTRTEHGTVYDVIEVLPARLQAIDLWLDHRTHLIARFGTAGGVQTDVSDYRWVGAVMVPFKSVSEGVTVTSDAVQFEHRSPATASLFSRP